MTLSQEYVAMQECSGVTIMLPCAAALRKPGLPMHTAAENGQAEGALQRSEVQYRRLFETARVGILILDAETETVLDSNPFMTELLGYSHAEFLGKELWEIGLFSEKAANEATFRELQQHGYVRYDHLPLERKDDTRVEVEFVSNVYQVDGKTVAQCNIRDISDRSRLERKTKEQAEALADLHRRKDEFLAMLSHELRNPLAPILNAVQLLQLQHDENGIQQQARTIIERQLGQLVHLVDDLLEVSRIATGKIQLHREQLDMRVIVERGLETVRPLIVQRQHSLFVRVPPAAIWIAGDSNRLEQVVVNLLNNAAKYTEERGKIWLSLRQDGNEAVLQVRDSGVGIAPEVMPRIFDLFTQSERSLARSQGGLGIGLSVVQRLVELHGGNVAVYSTLEEGSEFIVRLPVMVVNEPQLPPPIKETEPNRPSLRVLVVDDSADTAQTLAMLLKASGQDVRMAHDGPSTLQIALDYRPHAILLDLGLPGLDGCAVAKRLREQSGLRNVVLVAITGYGQEADRQRTHEAGFNHHLVKPANFGKVQQLLANISEGANPATCS